MTLEEFSDVFALLAVQLYFSDADEVTIRAYYDVMRAIEVELVKEAANRLARRVGADGKVWFPKVPEWLVEALRVQEDWREQQRAILRRLPEPLCKRCKDTGWKRMSTGRVKVCECRERRRLELLGRVPLPKQLTAGKA